MTEKKIVKIDFNRAAHSGLPPEELARQDLAQEGFEVLELVRLPVNHFTSDIHIEALVKPLGLPENPPDVVTLDENEFLDNLIAMNIPNDLSQVERTRRLQLVESSLGILTQMRKLNSTKTMAAMNELHILRTIARDVLGIRGESL